MVVDVFSGTGGDRCWLDSMESDGNGHFDVSIVRIGGDVVQPSALVVQESVVAQNASRYPNILGHRTGVVFDDDDSLCDHTIVSRGSQSGQSSSDFVAWRWIDGLGASGLHAATYWSAVGRVTEIRVLPSRYPRLFPVVFRQRLFGPAECGIQGANRGHFE